MAFHSGKDYIILKDYTGDLIHQSWFYKRKNVLSISKTFFQYNKRFFTIDLKELKFYYTKKMYYELKDMTFIDLKDVEWIKNCPNNLSHPKDVPFCMIANCKEKEMYLFTDNQLTIDKWIMIFSCLYNKKTQKSLAEKFDAAPLLNKNPSIIKEITNQKEQKESNEEEEKKTDNLRAKKEEAPKDNLPKKSIKKKEENEGLKASQTLEITISDEKTEWSINLELNQQNSTPNSKIINTKNILNSNTNDKLNKKSSLKNSNIKNNSPNTNNDNKESENYENDNNNKKIPAKNPTSSEKKSSFNIPKPNNSNPEANTLSNSLKKLQETQPDTSNRKKSDTNTNKSDDLSDFPLKKQFESNEKILRHNSTTTNPSSIPRIYKINYQKKSQTSNFMAYNDIHNINSKNYSTPRKKTTNIWGDEIEVESSEGNKKNRDSEDSFKKEEDYAKAISDLNDIDGTSKYKIFDKEKGFEKINDIDGTSKYKIFDKEKGFEKIEDKFEKSKKKEDFNNDFDDDNRDIKGYNPTMQGNSNGFNKGNDSFDNSNDSFNKGYNGFNKSNESFKKPNDSFNKPYDSFNKPQDSFNKEKEIFNKGNDNSFNEANNGFSKGRKIVNKINETFKTEIPQKISNPVHKPNYDDWDE